MRHVIVHQFDPHQHVAGGIDGLVRELVRFAPEEEEVSLVGVQTKGAGPALGKWSTVDVLGRDVRFMPVAHIDRNERRRIPHTIKFVAGLLRYRPDLRGAIIHSHRAEVSAVLSVLYPDATRLLLLHGDWMDDLRYKSDSYWRFFPPAYEALERFAVKKADRTISYMGQQGYARLRRHTSRVSRGRNWFVPSLSRCSPDRPNGTFVIAWIGRLEAPKDPLKAIETFNCLRQTGFAFEAWMAGSGILDNHVQQAVRKHRLDDHVELLGLLRPGEVARRLRDSHVLLMTSQFEGFPRVAVESLAAGVPVVAPAVGALPELIIDGVNGLLAARPASSAELAELVARSADLPYGPTVAATVDHLSAVEVISGLFEELESIESPSR